MFSAVLLVVMFQSAPQAAAPEALKAFAEANAAFEKRENDKALAAYDRAIALDATNPDFHLGRCRTLARLQRHQEAIQSCSRTLSLRPDHAAALVDRGHFYINVGKIDLALADLERAETLANDDYGLFYHLALARYLNGEFAKAADAYVGCVRTATTPDSRTSCKAWQYLALARAGRKSEAQALLDAFSPEPDQQPSAYIDRLLLFKGVKSEADVAQTMAKDALQRSTVGYSIGIWHLLAGREQKAREYFEQATASTGQPSAFGAVAASVELQRMKQ